ncbi:MAG TPA: hypothetical protein VGV64_06330 [Thermoplasmata archaeon]|nr:hypothetical protein [Thermoplasmata archaeon]
MTGSAAARADRGASGGSPRRSPRWLAPALLVLLCLPSLAPSAAAGSVPSSSSPSGSASWAFGADRTVSASGTARDGVSTYSIQATFGWHTIVSQTNVSSNVSYLQANRTMGGTLSATYCRPNCQHPGAMATINERAWETELGFANFTTQGSVLEGGKPVPALAILNSSARLRGSLLETESVWAMTVHGRVTQQARLTVSTSAHATVTFQPALGLVPLNLSGASAWNSSATYSAQGAWNVSYAYTSTSFTGFTTSRSGSAPGNFSRPGGLVYLNGSVLGAELLTGGLSTQAVSLQVAGPFSIWDGLLLVPAASDLYGASGTAGWSSVATGTQSASTASVDVGARGTLGHLPVLASAVRFSSAATNNGTTAPSVGPSNALTTDSVPFDGPAPTVIQGQPEGVSVAQSSAGCLIAACSTPGAAGRLPMGTLVVAAVVGLGAVIGGIAVARRQPPKSPPVSPTAALYRAGAAAGGRKTERPNPAEPVEEPDPLGHLW